MNFEKRALAGAIALAVSQTVAAGTAPYFIPLTSVELVEPADSVDEQNKPWTAPAGITSTNVMNMRDVETAVIAGSVVRVDAISCGRSSNNVASMFDMLAYDPTGRYVFVPHETPCGAGVSRIDTQDSNRTEVLFRGDQTQNWSTDHDFGAFDPARWTPNGTVILGEEWAGTGRIVEVCDPLGTAPVDPVASSLTKGDCAVVGNDYNVWNNMPLSAQEGIAFSQVPGQENKVMYFIDENNSGSIYKSVFTTAGDYNGGATTYVLSVDAFAGDPSANYNDASNVGQPRTGQATWVPITDATGAPLPGLTDPRVGAFTARTTANEVNGTPYGRPEDTTQSFRNGNEVIFFTATSENSVYAVEETATGPVVHQFVSPATPTNLGFAPTNATLGSPDNLAIDALGNIFVIEDSPNTTTVGANGGDIWFARDVDNDLQAESIDHFLSLQVNQSEATGMIFNPVDPTKFVVAVQHPQSTNLGDVAPADGVRDAGNTVGFGDAVWEFDISSVVAPACVGSRAETTTFNAETGRWVRGCVSTRGVNFIEQLEASESAGDFPTP